MSPTDVETCRLLVDAPRDGAENMAIDELLLEQAIHEGQASLRFYAWRTPTLSLGYFQPHAERSEHAPSRALPVVRRLSGGGALVHDQELTYALCLPSHSQLARSAAQVYACIHRALIRALIRAGASQSVEAVCVGDLPAANPQEHPPADVGRSEPFLCFARRTSDDVVAKPASLLAGTPSPWHKIAGSAQRRRTGALLQHGAVLWGRSPSAPEFPGLRELGAAETALASLIARWTAEISEAMASIGNFQWVRCEQLWLPEEQIAQRVRERFGNESWTLRR